MEDHDLRTRLQKISLTLLQIKALSTSVDIDRKCLEGVAVITDIGHDLCENYGKAVNTHDALHRLRMVLLDLIDAEKYTNAPTCIMHIRRASMNIHKVADELGLDLANWVDPMQ